MLWVEVRCLFWISVKEVMGAPVESQRADRWSARWRVVLPSTSQEQSVDPELGVIDELEKKKS